MILVIGATGKVGHHVVSELREQSAPVRALVRDPDTAVLPEGIEVMHGDLSDLGGLAEQLAGVQGSGPSLTPRARATL